ncbi:hypothetical protein [Amycolatopsis taiwanensis]|uniref:hypothetical protein n=1 Tax=Amycolatopsis taiwanensis TaxID=342230 RepID=UPI0004852D72|nr:hypothetical protein [Amycolatopsis taiwanensis]
MVSATASATPRRVRGNVLGSLLRRVLLPLGIAAGGALVLWLLFSLSGTGTASAATPAPASQVAPGGVVRTKTSENKNDKSSGKTKSQATAKTKPAATKPTTSGGTSTPPKGKGKPAAKPTPADKAKCTAQGGASEHCKVSWVPGKKGKDGHLKFDVTGNKYKLNTGFGDTITGSGRARGSATKKALSPATTCAPQCRIKTRNGDVGVVRNGTLRLGSRATADGQAQGACAGSGCQFNTRDGDRIIGRGKADEIRLRTRGTHGYGGGFACDAGSCDARTAGGRSLVVRGGRGDLTFPTRKGAPGVGSCQVTEANGFCGTSGVGKREFVRCDTAGCGITHAFRTKNGTPRTDGLHAGAVCTPAPGKCSGPAKRFARLGSLTEQQIRLLDRTYRPGKTPASGKHRDLATLRYLGARAEERRFGKAYDKLSAAQQAIINAARGGLTEREAVALAPKLNKLLAKAPDLAKWMNTRWLLDSVNLAGANPKVSARDLRSAVDRNVIKALVPGYDGNRAPTARQLAAANKAQRALLDKYWRTNNAIAKVNPAIERVNRRIDAYRKQVAAARKSGGVITSAEAKKLNKESAGIDRAQRRIDKRLKPLNATLAGVERKLRGLDPVYATADGKKALAAMLRSDNAGINDLERVARASVNWKSGQRAKIGELDRQLLSLAKLNYGATRDGSFGPATRLDLPSSGRYDRVLATMNATETEA